ncbi:hypothetical protein ACFVJH_27095 [Streptomyces decoyicus]|uniref:hypothetical protein n=1 Tax=Streptomyces decoyicus TaxID=249567 RepID=UPI00362CCF4A
MKQTRKKQATPAPGGEAKKAKRKPTGRARRLDNEARRANGAQDGARTYRPEELLSPATLLARFTERAQALITELPEDDRPRPAAVSTALRQAVLEAFRTREEFMARMVETDLIASAPEQRLSVLRRTIRTSLNDQGLRRIDSPEGEPEHFVVVEGEGDGFELLRPAYVDQATGKLLLSGQLRRVPTPAQQDRTAATDGEAEGDLA